MERNDDLFTYGETGFSILLKGSYRKVEWNEINEIIAYKRDLVTTDQVCLDIVLDESIISFSEENNGWDGFVKKMNAMFPTIDQDWERKVTYPPFATNLTILYKKQLSLACDQ